jgi:hypothetical protein
MYVWICSESLTLVMAIPLLVPVKPKIIPGVFDVFGLINISNDTCGKLEPIENSLLRLESLNNLAGHDPT